MDMSQHNLHRTGGHIVQELAVMGDQEHRTSEILQIILKPLDGFYIQVVGRFVQKQNIGGRQQDLGKFDAHIPALAEGFGVAIQLIGLETQTKKYLLGTGLRRKTGLQCQGVVYFVQPFN